MHPFLIAVAREAFKESDTLIRKQLGFDFGVVIFALNPDDYKQTVYRQQFKGDTKAYAATPMMVRVKSDQGLKRALNLIAELERIFELKAGDPADLLSIRGSYLFEETEALVEKGLIKTRTVKVPAYEAERLLKKKIK